MTDLHTHILPCLDDGSSSTAESLELLRMEREERVDTVVLTPHFYRNREPVGRFLDRRQAALETLLAARTGETPALFLGAEVAWYPSLSAEDDLDQLCLNDTRYLLLELPFEPWTPLLLNQVYDFAGSTGVTPILAHVERYLSIEDKARIRDLTSMGFPMQMNADSLLRFWSRKRCLELLRHGTWYLGSDCHNLEGRPPRISQAAAVLREKLGRDAADRILNGPDLKRKEAAVP